MSGYKQQFHLPEGSYLLSHSVGCLPRQTKQVQARFIKLWQEKGDGAWDEWLASIERFRLSLAKLLNGQARDICPQVNVSSAVSKVLSSLPWRPEKNKILISQLDFPSVGFALSQAERSGYQIVKMPAINGGFTLESWLSYLTEDTRLALITHSLYGNSFLNPVGDIVRLARQRQIFTLIDIAQSAGVVPIDLQQWNADFVVGSCIKWLCGGPGAGFLWANPAQVDQFLPMDVGWFSHEDPFEFDINHFVYATGAQRFFGGTPSVLPYMIASAGIDVINQIGVKSIRAHNQAMTTLLVQQAQAMGFNLLSPADPWRRGGTVCIGFKRPEKVCEQLRKEKVLVDYRPAFGVRFSPHIYNDEDDLARTCGALDRLREQS